MGFYSITDESFSELDHRLSIRDKLLSTGIRPLDDAFRAIFPDDLVLIGAPSGAGKTQLCCNIAYANLFEGKRVHYIALEASEFEITRRFKYKMIVDFYLHAEGFDLESKKTEYIKYPNFADWSLGKYVDLMRESEEEAARFFEKAYGSLFLYHKADKFGLDELIKSICIDSTEASVVIIDHVHYFDLDDEIDENKAIKKIAKTVRDLALEEQKPIFLVAHLRKRDRGYKEICPGMEEFHGSSDLFKIATKVITMAPGEPTNDGGYVTYFRIPKNRIDGGVSRYLIKAFYDPSKGGYKNEYLLGKLGTEEFAQIERHLYPRWATYTGDSSSRPTIPVRQQRAYKDD